MSVSNKHYPTTVSEKRSYKKYRQERKDTAELREQFEREAARVEQALVDYLRVKGEIE